MSLKASIFAGAATVALSVGAGWVITGESPMSILSSLKAAVGIKSDPDKLGWLDDAPLTDGDRARISAIVGSGQGSNLGVIRSMQAGGRGQITRRDFELLRQDRRRAKAAYPSVSDDDLYTGVWLQVDVGAKIPDGFCTSGNSNGTQVDGKWYLDGGCYVGSVRPEYPNREDAAGTKRILDQLNDTKRQKQIAHLAKWGYSSSWGGTDGSASVDGYPDPLPSNEDPDDRHVAGQVVIIIDRETKYQFVFVPADWINAPSSKEGLIRIAESHGAAPSNYTAPPNKPWVVKDGLLARGETCPEGRLCRSWWNGDGYDNSDIGPVNPESWVLEQPFGLAYLPAPDNGERCSDPGKPWFLVITYYGTLPQVSGGWNEQDAKQALPRFQTGHSFGMAGQDQDELNRGNLKEARATQNPPSGGIVLADRALPVQPSKAVYPHEVPYFPSMTLLPGQSTTIGVSSFKQ